jgi:hypothetical protein
VHKGGLHGVCLVNAAHVCDVMILNEFKIAAARCCDDVGEFIISPWSTFSSSIAIRRVGQPTRRQPKAFQQLQGEADFSVAAMCQRVAKSCSPHPALPSASAGEHSTAYAPTEAKSFQKKITCSRFSAKHFNRGGPGCLRGLTRRLSAKPAVGYFAEKQKS